MWITRARSINLGNASAVAELKRRTS
jgi:hypothetical protein